MAVLKSHYGYYLYHYVPSIVASAIFAVLFAMITIGHFWRMFRTKTWFVTAFVIGGICMPSASDT